MKKHFDKLPSWAQRSTLWSACAVGIFGVYAGAPKIGVDLPRPAWAGEVRAVDKKHSLRMSDIEIQMAGVVSDLSAKIDTSNKAIQNHLYGLEARNVRRDLNVARVSLRNARVEINQRQKKGAAVPRDLFESEAALETQIDELTGELDRLKRAIE